MSNHRHCPSIRFAFVLLRPATALIVAAVAWSTGPLAGCSSAEDDDGPESAGGPIATAPAAPDGAAPTGSPGEASLPADHGPLARRSELGRTVYEQQCLICHGPAGRGDGSMVGALPVKPRSFVNESWKYLDPSSPGAELSSMIALLERGLPAAMMPPYKGTLSTEQLDEVARYVLHLRAGGS